MKPSVTIADAAIVTEIQKKCSEGMAESQHGENSQRESSLFIHAV